jgi:hypothetical protein
MHAVDSDSHNAGGPSELACSGFNTIVFVATLLIV